MHIICGVCYNFRRWYTGNIFRFLRKILLLWGAKSAAPALLPGFIPPIWVFSFERSRRSSSGRLRSALSEPRQPFFSTFTGSDAILAHLQWWFEPTVQPWDFWICATAGDEQTVFQCQGMKIVPNPFFFFFSWMYGVRFLRERHCRERPIQLNWSWCDPKKWLFGTLHGTVNSVQTSF